MKPLDIFNVTPTTLLVATKPDILMRCRDNFLLVGDDRTRSAKICSLPNPN